MRNLEELQEGNLHHAYSIEGDNKIVFQAVCDFFERRLEFNTKNNPDFHHQKYETLGIEDARKLIELQSTVSFGDSKKVFVIEADSITIDAQNSLLKILEEPTPNSHFFIIGSCVKNLIETLNSRLAKISLDAGQENESETDKTAETFLKSNLSDRMEIVKKLTDEIKTGKKPKNEAVMLVKKIEKAIYQKTNLMKSAEMAPVLSQIEICQNYISDRSAGVKMLLEYVAIITPRG